jgi:hypothetical protein
METGEVQAPKGHTKLEPLFRRKLESSGVRRERWWPEETVFETALAVSPGDNYIRRTGTRDEKEAWKASTTDEWLVGTADAHWWMFDHLYVDDLKTGRMVSWESYQHQVAAYCLGIARCADYRGPVHATLTHWPRYPTNSQPMRFGMVLEADYLTRFEKRLVVLRDSILRAREDRDQMVLTSGEHCTWCNSRDLCPEFNNGDSHGS